MMITHEKRDNNKHHRIFYKCITLDPRFNGPQINGFRIKQTNFGVRNNLQTCIDCPLIANFRLV